MFKAVLDSRHFDVTARVVFDFSRNDIGNLSDLDMAVRHLFVLKKRSADAADGGLSKWLQISSDYVRDAKKYAWRRTIRDRSAMFLRDRFHSGYSRLRQIRDNARARNL